jgi:hypothetical protein
MRDTTRLGPWILLILGALGVLLASWNLFPQDKVGTEIANVVAVIATVSLLDAAWLNSALPRVPGIGIGVLSGAGLILIGALWNNGSTAIAFTSILAGIVVAVGALFSSSEQPA